MRRTSPFCDHSPTKGLLVSFDKSNVGQQQQLLQLVRNRAHVVSPAIQAGSHKRPRRQPVSGVRGRSTRRLPYYWQPATLPKILEKYQAHHIERVCQPRRTALADLDGGMSRLYRNLTDLTQPRLFSCVNARYATSANKPELSPCTSRRSFCSQTALPDSHRSRYTISHHHLRKN